MPRTVTEDDNAASMYADLGSESDFRRRIRAKLAARGVAGDDLKRQIDDLMTRDVGFRFNLPDVIDT